MKEPKRCKRCVTPITRPGLIVDEGVCSACRWEKEKDKEVIKFSVLEKFVKDGKADHPGLHQYHCLIPVSGGKDSWYQTYVATKILHLNVLAVTWECCQTTKEGKANLENLIKVFDVSHVMMRPSQYPAEMRKGLIESGDCCMPCHKGIFHQTMTIAKAFDIPLVLWGENPRKEYGGNAEVGIDKPLEVEGVTNLYLGDYINWDAKTQVALMKTMGFIELKTPPHGAWLKYENIDCGYVGIHDYFAYLKFGMSRASIQLSIEIRKGRMTRDKALKTLSYIEPVLRPEGEVQRFLDFSGTTEEEFANTEQRFTGTW